MPSNNHCLQKKKRSLSGSRFCGFVSALWQMQHMSHQFGPAWACAEVQTNVKARTKCQRKKKNRMEKGHGWETVWTPNGTDDWTSASWDDDSWHQAFLQSRQPIGSSWIVQKPTRNALKNRTEKNNTRKICFRLFARTSNRGLSLWRTNWVGQWVFQPQKFFFSPQMRLEIMHSFEHNPPKYPSSYSTK